MGQVGKTALSCPLICKHSGPNLFSTCPLSVMSDGGESICYTLTFHSALEKLLVNVLKEFVCARGLGKPGEVLSDKHLPYESS